MNKPILSVTLLAAVLMLPAAIVTADDDSQPKPQSQTKQERIYGSQLMSKEEHLEYRKKMHAAKTREERLQIRAEHHEEMKRRAKERGIELPDKPMERGMKKAKGDGQGMGPGKGMGPGNGKGPGSGQGKDGDQ